MKWWLNTPQLMEDIENNVLCGVIDRNIFESIQLFQSSGIHLMWNAMCAILNEQVAQK